MIMIFGILLWNDISKCLHFLDIFNFWAVAGVKGQKRPKMTINSVSLCILGTVSHMVRVLHLCKMMIYPAIFFHYFKILIFQVFQVNANRKFWGVCAPPSSHVCNFLWIGLTSGNKVLKKQLFHLGIAYAVLTLYNYSFP